MKRILTSFAFVAASLAFAQVSITGEADATPRATLDVKAIPNSSTPDGILIPNINKDRAQLMNAPVNSTLAYIKNEGTGGDRTGNVDADGFYYFNEGKWVKIGAGASAADASLYAADGVLEANRSVNQNNNNLTFTTGTGALEINGTSKLMGGSYVNVTRVDGTSYTVTPNDYYITVDGASGEVIITLPDPAQSEGRILMITNTTSGNVAMKKAPDNEQALYGTDIGSISKDNGMVLICDGKKWFNLIGF